jgi:hypothetical protein
VPSIHIRTAKNVSIAIFPGNAKGKIHNGARVRGWRAGTTSSSLPAAIRHSWQRFGAPAGRGWRTLRRSLNRFIAKSIRHPGNAGASRSQRDGSKRRHAWVAGVWGGGNRWTDICRWGGRFGEMAASHAWVVVWWGSPGCRRRNRAPISRCAMDGQPTRCETSLSEWGGPPPRSRLRRLSGVGHPTRGGCAWRAANRGYIQRKLCGK